ncbi:MAG: indolepyruvate oxidoreductase subunit beta family protein [Rubrivivax sp.]|nr:indolepyruvate oxidoreductase subunit beta family protein [Rubrivivax sp.]
MHTPVAAAPAPITRVLIAALGGEGGGVLAGWLVQCARDADLPVQASSVPGVAQRTGATSYYIEWLAAPAPPAAPVFALHPLAGQVDVLVASELVEAGRMVERGYVAAGTTLITSTHRVYTTLEKMAPTDGRYDDGAVLRAARVLAGRCIAFDMGRVARERGTVVSAVMFGALAGAAALPWPRSACEAVIGDGGRGVAASLAGFAAGFDAAAAGGDEVAAAGAVVVDELGAGALQQRASAVAAAALSAAAAAALQAAPAGADTARWQPRLAALPAPVQATAVHGLLRCLDFQGSAYATRFLDAVTAICAAAGSAGVAPATTAGAARSLAVAEDAAGPLAVAEDAARSLALWMCFEDVIRVADLKTRRARYTQLHAEVAARPGELVRVTEMLKPGVEEVAAILPRRLGQALMRTAARRGWIGRAHVGLQLRSTSAWGFALLRLLAALRPLRPHSLRQAEEDQAVTAWCQAMGQALPRSTAYAAALARLPEVLKGYGETQRRGRAAYARLWAEHVAPALAEPAGLDARAAAFAAAQRAALSLAPPPATPAATPAAAVSITPQPLHFFRTRPGSAPPPGA